MAEYAIPVLVATAAVFGFCLSEARSVAARRQEHLAAVARTARARRRDHLQASLVGRDVIAPEQRLAQFRQVK